MNGQPLTPADLQQRAIDKARHFTLLARSGRHPSASAGEKAAHRIAALLHELGDDVMLLDPKALQGACDLLRMMGGPFDTDAQKTATYNIVAIAAGKEDEP